VKRALVFGLTAVLAGCASNSSKVTLLNNDQGKPSGRVVVLDPETGAEKGELAAMDVTTKVGGRTLKGKPLKDGVYSDLNARVPYAPRVYVMYFYEGTTDITEESVPILQALKQAVKATSEVQITGHTDTVGRAADNDKLSLERAKEIRGELLKDGLPVQNARVTGRGERELRVATPDNTDEPANRRVEVILR
jgi:outer membrane protein OmpA-like peptidoglycan-associated protein